MRNGIRVARLFGINIIIDTGQLPVLEGGHLVGMVRRRDVLRWLQLQSQSERA